MLVWFEIPDLQILTIRRNKSARGLEKDTVLIRLGGSNELYYQVASCVIQIQRLLKLNVRFFFSAPLASALAYSFFHLFLTSPFNFLVKYCNIRFAVRSLQVTQFVLLKRLLLIFVATLQCGSLT